MWEIPVAAKVRVAPYLVLVVVGLALLNSAGSLDQPAKASGSDRVGGPSAFARANIPARYLALYRKAGGATVWTTRKGGRYPAWAVLAAIGKVETNHCRAHLPGVRSGENYAGAGGCMQFLAPTWRIYGRGSRYDPAQAVPAARRLLVANGARRDLDRAIWHYNHSSAYVANVKALARRYTRR